MQLTCVTPNLPSSILISCAASSPRKSPYLSAVAERRACDTSVLILSWALDPVSLSLSPFYHHPHSFHHRDGSFHRGDEGVAFSGDSLWGCTARVCRHKCFSGAIEYPTQSLLVRSHVVFGTTEKRAHVFLTGTEMMGGGRLFRSKSAPQDKL